MPEKPKKFLQLVPFYPTPFKLHRKEDYFLLPADVMAAKGMEVEFVTLRNTAPTSEYVTGKGNIAPPFEVVEGYPVRRFDGILSLYRYMRRQRDAMVHVHLRPYPPSQFSGFVLPQKKVLSPFTYLLGSNLAIRLLTKLVMPRFDQIHCFTPYELEIYRKAGIPEKKLRLIPLSIDYDYFSAKPHEAEINAAKERFGFADSELVVISVAQVRKNKRFDTVIKALKVIKETVPSAKFLAVGDDWLPRQGVPGVMETAASVGVKDSVILTGFQQMDSLRALLHSSSVFVNAADNETQGLVTYEAAAAGVPLCLSGIGSHTTVFGDSALYHEVADHGSLARNILKYYEDSALRRKNTSHLRERMKEWDYSAIKKKMSDAYDELIG